MTTSSVDARVAALEEQNKALTATINNSVGELNTIRLLYSTSVESESRLVKILTWVIPLCFAVFTAGSGWFTMWSRDKVDDTIKEAKQQLAAMVGGYQPVSAKTTNLNNVENGPVLVRLDLTVHGDEIPIRYEVQAVASYEVSILGDAGRIIGYRNALSPDFALPFSRDFSGRLVESSYENLISGTYSPERSPDGRLISADASTNMYTTVTRNFEQCGKAKKFIRDLVTSKVEDFYWNAGPVFSNIKTAPPMGKFPVTFEYGLGYDSQCLSVNTVLEAATGKMADVSIATRQTPTQTDGD